MRETNRFKTLTNLAFMVFFFLFSESIAHAKPILITLSPHTPVSTVVDTIFQHVTALQGIQSYDTILNSVRKEYTRFTYPNVSLYKSDDEFKAALNRMKREITRYAIGKISYYGRNLDLNRVNAHLRAAYEKLSDYGAESYGPFNVRVRPILKNIYVRLLTGQKSWLLNLLRKYGKYQAVVYHPHPTDNHTLASNPFSSMFAPTKNIIDVSAMANAYLQESKQGEEYVCVNPILFSWQQKHYVVPNASRGKALLYAIQFLSLSFDRPSISTLVAQYNPHKLSASCLIKPDHFLLRGLEIGQHNWENFPSYVGHMDLVQIWGHFPLHVSITFWVVIKGETKGNQRNQALQNKDIEPFVDQIAQSLCDSFKFTNQAPSEPSSEPIVSTPANIFGIWQTNFGKMTLEKHGSLVTGHYEHDNGKIIGFLKGNVLSGKWSEAPTYKPDHDAGNFRFVFSKDGTSFKGSWRYGFSEKGWDGTWTGQRARP